MPTQYETGMVKLERKQNFMWKVLVLDFVLQY